MGEYAVLRGLPAILLTTPPYFRYEKNCFIDPYQGQGGFGASGARFIFELFNRFPEKKYLNPWEVWAHYKSDNLSGSGADVLAQSVGGATLVDIGEKKIVPLELSDLFKQFSIVLIQTGQKIMTHAHIKSFKQTSVLNDYFYKNSFFETTVRKAHQAVIKADWALFLEQVQGYTDALQTRGLIFAGTQLWVEKIKQLPGVMLAKGCGALGADVILVVLKKDARFFFRQWAQGENLRVTYEGSACGSGAVRL